MGLRKNFDFVFYSTQLEYSKMCLIYVLVCEYDSPYFSHESKDLHWAFLQAYHPLFSCDLDKPLDARLFYWHRPVRNIYPCNCIRSEVWHARNYVVRISHRPFKSIKVLVCYRKRSNSDILLCCRIPLLEAAHIFLHKLIVFCIAATWPFWIAPLNNTCLTRFGWLISW